MRVLVLGGTGYLGRPIVLRLAQIPASKVVVVSRGKTKAKFYPGVDYVKSDRLELVENVDLGRFDAIVDLCARDAIDVHATKDFLRPSGHYVLMSTSLVYDLGHTGACTEDAPTVAPLSGSHVSSPATNYPGFKRGAEAAAHHLFRKLTIIRPCRVLGPGEPDLLLSYWVSRLSEPGDHAVPESLDAHIQLLDPRDLANWLVGQVLTSELLGTFNAAGIVRSFADMLSICRAELSRWDQEASRLVPVPRILLHAYGVDFPLYIEDCETHARVFNNVGRERALKTGLRPRSLEAVIRETSQRISSADRQRLREKPPQGLSREQETAILRSLHRDA